MYFETLEMNSGRPTGICVSPLIAASGGVVELGGIQKDTETDRGGSGATAEAQREDQSGLTADERRRGREARAERGGTPTSTEETVGHPDPDTVTAGRTDAEAEVKKDRGAEVEM